MGVRPAGGGLAAARAHRAGARARRAVRRRARRAARPRRPAARLADAGRGGGRAAPGAAAEVVARDRDLLHRPVRVGQVHARPGPARRAARARRPDRLAARRGPGPTAAVGRADVLPRGPGPEHRPHRVRGGRDRAARRDRDLRADRTVRGGPGGGAGDGLRGRRLPPGARVDAARGVRGARPQGPLRAGASRDDRLVHRDLRPVRGARRRGRRHRHLARLQAGSGRGGARSADPRRLARLPARSARPRATPWGSRGRALPRPASPRARGRRWPRRRPGPRGRRPR